MVEKILKEIVLSEHTQRKETIEKHDVECPYCKKWFIARIEKDDC